MRWLAGLVVVAGLSPGLAWAWPGTVEWPTYERTGPGKQYGVLDEAQRGQTFEVLSCDGDWCRVRGSEVAGYLERWTLGTPGQPVAPGAPGDCIEVRLAGHTVKGQPFRICGQPGG